MPVTITIRDVPEKVRDELAARAARAGQSLQEYLRGRLVESVSRPALADVFARARARVNETGLRVDAESILSARDADRRGHDPGQLDRPRLGAHPTDESDD